MTCNLKCDKMFSNMNEMFLKYMLKYRLHHQKISRSKFSKIHTLLHLVRVMAMEEYGP